MITQRSRMFRTRGAEKKRKEGAARKISAPLRLCVSTILCLVLFSMAGCSTTGQSIDALFAAANSQLASAQKAGAERLAESEFEKAKARLAEAEIASKNNDKETRSLVEKAHAQARLAEALAEQAQAESELAQSAAELEKVSAKANSVRLERKAAESQLDQRAD